MLGACAHAQDTKRIDQLETEVQSLKVRLAKIEAALGGQSAAPKPVILGEGWKSLSAWRQLKNGMSTDEVRNILGEPDRLDGGTIANWIYPNGGHVTFYRDKADHWSEPTK